MVYKTCCKAVSVTISFAHRPTLQTTEGHSHTAWVLFLSSRHTSWNNLWSSVNLPALPNVQEQRRCSIVHIYGFIGWSDIEAQVSCVRKGSTAASSDPGMMDRICRREWRGPPQVGATSFPAICQRWVGTDPWPGLGGGDTIQGRPLHLTHFQVWGGRKSARCLCSAESNSTTFCSDQMTFIARCVLYSLGNKLKYNKTNKLSKIGAVW